MKAKKKNIRFASMPSQARFEATATQSKDADKCGEDFAVFLASLQRLGFIRLVKDERGELYIDFKADIEEIESYLLSEAGQDHFERDQEMIRALMDSKGLIQ